LLLIGALVTFNIGLGGANIDVSVSTSIDNLAVLPQSATWLLPLSALLLGLFIFVEGRVRDPLIDLKLFRSRNLSAGSLTNLFVGYCLFIGLVIVPILVNVRVESEANLRSAALQVGL